MTQVSQIKGNFPTGTRQIVGVTMFDLGKTGQTRFDLVPVHVARVQFFVGNPGGQHSRNMRPRSDKRHLPAQDVDQLGQLVQLVQLGQLGQIRQVAQRDGLV